MKKNILNSVLTLDFNNIELLSACGDIHGDFSELENQIVDRYKMENSITIVCGDIGIGFHLDTYYKLEFLRINSILSKNNNHIILFRGNHDNPIYFNGEKNKLFKSYSHIHVIPDYTVIKCHFKDDISHNILCIGGGISIDRTYRIKNGLKLKKELYWENENVVYDENKLNEILNQYPGNIQTVCTHTAPSFCFPHTRDGIMAWLFADSKLGDDIDIERNSMNKLYDFLIENNFPISNWFYGHFHKYVKELIDNTWFTLLNCNQITEIK